MAPILLLYVGVSAVVLILLVRSVWFDPYSAATHGLSEVGIEIWPRIVWVADVLLVGWLFVSLRRGLLSEASPGSIAAAEEPDGP